MKKYYLIAVLLSALVFVWCGKQVEVVEPQVDLSSAESIMTIENPVDVCEEKFIPAYRGKLDLSQTLSAHLQDYSKAIITAKFSDNFIEKYRYEDSDKFFFALKVFVWDYTDNGWYYNVLRTRTNSVANRTHLTGAVLAYQLKDGFTWEIPLNETIDVANSEFIEWKQMVKINLSDYFKEWDTRIGAYVSAVKELKWRELADINIKLCK